MKNTIHSELFQEAAALLEAAGILLSEEQSSQLLRYMELIQQWNSYASLVSIPDLDKLFECHVVDALSLAPLIQQYGQPPYLLDIGSGGGFPAIPLCIALPDLRATLVERSLKKIGFLRKILGALPLKNVELIHGVFPKDIPAISPTLITARAVERPEVLTPTILDYLTEGVRFFCQSGQLQAIDSEMFHVEPIEDIWQEKGLRRGSLHLISRR